MRNELDNPEMIVIGGPNGAGKTTFATRFLDLSEHEFLNADLEALKLNPDSPESVALTAGHLLLKRLTTLVENRESFLLESTLSGKTLLKRIGSARQQGYYTSIIYVFAISSEVCVSRVEQRVRKGGHHVPPVDVRRRYGRSVVNFWQQYRIATDAWALYYNSGVEYVELAYGEQDNFQVKHPTYFSQFAEVVDHHAKR
jgi:predicted ABC-type ATPase